MRSLRVAMAQVNPTVGDLDGNTRLILDAMEQARSLDADLVAFPELCLSGYPPEDLLLKPSFVRENRRRLDQIVAASKDLAVVVGFAEGDGADVYNGAAVIADGRLVDIYRKVFLPTYSVFDEDRYFRPGNRYPVYKFRGVTLGVNVCEDIWYATGPITVQRAAGAEVIVNINGSPYYRGKRETRYRMLSTRASDNGVYLCYVNMVGGQDELVFDGDSMVFDPSGALIAEGKQFQEDLVVLDLDVEAVYATRLHDPRWRKIRDEGQHMNGTRADLVEIPGAPAPRVPRLRTRPLPQPLDPLAEVYQALTVGTRDYVRKSGFQKVVIGISGGIDSSVTAAVAADALGPENVVGVSMPSTYSSPGSLTDAALLARNLGIEHYTVPIGPAFDAYRAMLSEVFAGMKEDVAEENIQARIRGNVLMALSNKFGWIVLATGNKSEYATGFTTLYGDMAGGYAVLKDVPKTLVYQLAEHRNREAGRDLIPEAVLKKAPSPELRPDHLTTDTLPPYPVLDPVLEAYVERDRSPEELLAMGFDQEVVRRAVQRVDQNEYKRRQAPPGVKITPRAFGKDRRLPIVNKFKPV